MRNLRTVTLAALALGPLAPPAPAAPKPEAKPPRLVTKRFVVKNCDPNDARQVFDAVADLAGPAVTVQAQGGTPGGTPGGGGPPGMMPPGTGMPAGWGPATPGGFTMPGMPPGFGSPPAPAGKRGTLRVVVDAQTRAVIARGTEKDLDLAADLVAVLDAPEDKAPPRVKHARVFRTKRDADELLQMLRGLEPDAAYKTAAVGRTKKRIIAAGPEEALKDLEATLEEIDVPAPAKQAPGPKKGTATAVAPTEGATAVRLSRETPGAAPPGAGAGLSPAGR